jgi:endonuclease/exonuclease/phosphatase family metal-dependent hydrolase
MRSPGRCRPGGNGRAEEIALRADPATIRIATWNIHKGVGLDWRCDLERVVALIRRHEPDIVALQEVDSRRPCRSGPPFEFLKQSLGEHCVEARAITAPDGDYGHMLISRWPFAETRLHDISVGAREPRRAIETTIETPHGPLHMVAVHLGLAFHERRHQAATLAALANGAPETSVLAGDFNDWIWRGRVNAALLEELPDRTWHRTFPSVLPTIRLDRIYCRPAGALLASWTDRAARIASDHLPVLAEIAIAR